MSHLMHVMKLRLVRLLGACALVAGIAGVPLVLTTGTANAAACSGAIPAGSNCTLTGTLGLSAGTLTLTPPTALAWTATDTGADQSVVDLTHATYAVNDATGALLGWHVTASATQFTSTTPAATLPNTGTLVNTGSTASVTAATAPTPTCASGASCVLPNNTTVTYPVGITTATTTPPTTTIYSAGALSGLGSIVIGGGANKVGWWVNVPGSATVSTAYTSTITMAIVSGP